MSKYLIGVLTGVVIGWSSGILIGKDLKPFKKMIKEKKFQINLMFFLGFGILSCFIILLMML